MISAFFDDSGTHETSDIVVVAGLLGTEARLDCLRRNWRKHIAYPLDGSKPRLRRFHMTECQTLRGEFDAWGRTEVEHFCYILRQTIIDADVSAYGVACARKDWDELVFGDYRHIFGRPEGFCIRNCFVRALAWARSNCFDPSMRFVFDARPSAVQRDAGTVFNAFEVQAQIDPELAIPQLAGISFESSYEEELLQAADLFAWEFYQHASDILVAGLARPKRIELRNLADQMQVHGQIATRSSIQEMIEKVWSKSKPGDLQQIAAHFRDFDRAKPDYSNLMTKPP